ncbi:hypothetical protein [Runella zeae]|uniref:hypothetical protein n=1 Tax=Runella zeae TaxID=94255 RepID=UPI00146B5BAE|nr:hypothetical protein [Runella zeae]
MKRRFHWSKTALLGLTLGAYLSACSTNLPEPRHNEPKAHSLKPASVSDSTLTAEAPPKDVNGGG